MQKGSKTRKPTAPRTVKDLAPNSAKVKGGATVSDITITKTYDKSSSK